MIKELYIKSNRGSLLPTIIVEGEKGGPLILMIHGFKADKTEDNRFIEVAKELAQYGINSVMFAQAGCGDSLEDFINYSLDNSLDDMEVVLNYMLKEYDIDINHIGMIGYSMGGRLASIFINRHPNIKALALWAAGLKFKTDSFLGNDYQTLRKEANEYGYCNFYNSFDDTYLKMNKTLLDNLDEYDPIAYLKEYKGNILFIHGDKDDTVTIDSSKEAYEELSQTKSKKLIIIKDGDHGFGAWDNRNELSKKLVEDTIDFFKENI